MIKNLYNQKKPVLSLEVFPPKKDTDIETIYQTLDALQTLAPDFISVTYGAGGSTSKKTIEIASYIQNQCKIEAVAHLTCAELDETSLQIFLDELKEHKVKNILALRGDIPKHMSPEEFSKRSFTHASDLVSHIRKNPFGSIGGACYPEVHPEANSAKDDILMLKKKAESGVDFFVTQLFFDNELYYRFLDNVRDAGIQTPISAGIMPITAASQIRRIVELSGSSVPSKLAHLVAKYADSNEDMKKAGLEFATMQIEDLLKHQSDGIHLYTMNKVDVSQTIFKNLGRI
ncbi:MAG: methylenetetrahydrofolate reductase [Clostridiales bacterium]|nr:methylenetetrahydrofolate reductase [Clostridiales bacterium]